MLLKEFFICIQSVPFSMHPAKGQNWELMIITADSVAWDSPHSEMFHIARQQPDSVCYSTGDLGSELDTLCKQVFIGSTKEAVELYAQSQSGWNPRDVTCDTLLKNFFAGPAHNPENAVELTMYFSTLTHNGKDILCLEDIRSQEVCKSKTDLGLGQITFNPNLGGTYKLAARLA